MFAFIKTLVLLSMLSVMVFEAQASFGFNDPPVCAKPAKKPVPNVNNCYKALSQYSMRKDGFLVSPVKQSQKSYNDCQIKLTASFKESTTLQVLPSAARDAINKIRKACPSGYGAVLIPRKSQDYQTPTILAIEVGSGRY